MIVVIFLLEVLLNCAPIMAESHSVTKMLLIFSSSGHFIQQSRTVWANLAEGIM